MVALLCSCGVSSLARVAEFFLFPVWGLCADWWPFNEWEAVGTFCMQRTLSPSCFRNLPSCLGCFALSQAGE